MKILYTLPGIGSHGGIRILIEHCNRLQALGHKVAILSRVLNKPNWIKIDDAILFTANYAKVLNYDVAVICSPHHIRMAKRLKAKKTFLFCQMREDMFKPKDLAWQQLCKEFYTSPYPMLFISEWNHTDFFNIFNRSCAIVDYYIGNGVNFEDFPISDKPKDGKTILLESPEPTNASKDVDRLALKVAKRLKDEGYRVIAFGRTPIDPEFEDVPDEYIINPTLADMNRMYEEASILVKATKYDARGCASLEAATKMTVTARAVSRGDDDLIDGVNCFRCDYNYETLLQNSLTLLTHIELRERLAKNYLEQIQKYNWDYWIKVIENIYIGNAVQQ